jgi:glycerate 2-kinase
LGTVERARGALATVFHVALAAVEGGARVRAYLEAHPLDGDVHLIAVGKAACAMAAGAGDVLGPRIGDGLVITKHGHGLPLPWPVLECGHPVPDAASLAAGERLVNYIAGIEPRETVLVLISGGASSLLELPVSGMDLEGIRRANQWLLASGLPIDACNRVRKRLSRVKAGGLGRLLAPRPVHGLLISDVPGDDPRTIGSGLLSFHEPGSLDVDTTGFPEFLNTMLRTAPAATPARMADFGNISVTVVASLNDAKAAAAAAAGELGYTTRLHHMFVDGDATRAGDRLAATVVEGPPDTVHIWGGETTVTLPVSPGRGGRNQHLALAAALRLRDTDGLLLAAGTDGTDGPTTDAGALVDGHTVSRGTRVGWDAAASLRAADAGGFLEASGDLLSTGPTGTNVMDLMLGLRTGE